jgi:uncharacterized membrane protein YhaH (DUF805 family)
MPSTERLFGYKGRATRREFGAMALATLVIFALSIALFEFVWGDWIGNAAFVDDFGENVLGRTIILLDLIPFGGCLATGSRRLHDTGRTGLWLLLGGVPVVGTLGLLILLALPGARGANVYGADPRAPNADWLRRVFS